MCRRSAGGGTAAAPAGQGADRRAHADAGTRAGQGLRPRAAGPYPSTQYGRVPPRGADHSESVQPDPGFQLLPAAFGWIRSVRSGAGVSGHSLCSRLSGDGLADDRMGAGPVAAPVVLAAQPSGAVHHPV